MILGGPGRADPEGKEDPLTMGGKAPVSSCKKSRQANTELARVLHAPASQPLGADRDEPFPPIALQQPVGLVATMIPLSPEQAPAGAVQGGPGPGPWGWGWAKREMGHGCWTRPPRTWQAIHTAIGWLARDSVTVNFFIFMNDNL